MRNFYECDISVPAGDAAPRGFVDLLTRIFTRTAGDPAYADGIRAEVTFDFSGAYRRDDVFRLADEMARAVAAAQIPVGRAVIVGAGVNYVFRRPAQAERRGGPLAVERFL